MTTTEKLKIGDMVDINPEADIEPGDYVRESKDFSFPAKITRIGSVTKTRAWLEDANGNDAYALIAILRRVEDVK